MLFELMKLYEYCVAGTMLMRVQGWCWDKAWSGGGVPAMTVRVSVDGKVVVPMTVANVVRPGLPATGCPNTEHGYDVALPSAAAATLAGTGLHRLNVDASTLYIITSPPFFKMAPTIVI